MNKELEQARKIFLDPSLDEDTIKDNHELIQKWEQEMQENANFASWIEHETTQSILSRMRESYKEISMMLMSNRDLDDTKRKSLYARQDAFIWFMSFVKKDPKSELQKLNAEIKRHIDAV